MVHGTFLINTVRSGIFNLDYLEELYLPDLHVSDVAAYMQTWGLGWNYDKSMPSYVDVFCGDGYVRVSGGQFV